MKSKNLNNYINVTIVKNKNKEVDSIDNCIFIFVVVGSLY